MRPSLFFLVSFLLCFIAVTSLQQVNEGEKGVMIVCEKCVSFWNALRDDFGCNGNSTLCNYFPYVSHDKCQAMINATCAAGCENNSTECAYVACCFAEFCEGSVCNITTLN